MEPSFLDTSVPTQLVHSPEGLPTSVSRQLLEFYSSDIAPLMVWLDSTQNEYKRLVIPLAETQQVLRLAIMAIAAGRAPHAFDVDDGFSRRAYENALRLITERVREMTDLEFRDHSPTDARTTASTNEATLAAMLILSNHSLLGAEISQAQLHRHAVRILIKAIAYTGTSDEELFDFLQNQAAIHDVLVCTTIFDPEYISQATLPISKHGEVMFGRFLCYVHDITTLSITDREHPSIGELEDGFELACSSTIMAAAAVRARSGRPITDDFTRIVRIYHHAGVLFGCKRLRISNEALHEEYHTSSLFRLFDQFEDLGTSLYNLAWPILIAGICSWPNIERIRLVRFLTKVMLEKTEFWYYSRIAAFHEELWESSNPDWMRLAADWERRGLQIIAV